MALYRSNFSSYYLVELDSGAYSRSNVANSCIRKLVKIKRFEYGTSNLAAKCSLSPNNSLFSPALISKRSGSCFIGMKCRAETRNESQPITEGTPSAITIIKEDIDVSSIDLCTSKSNSNSELARRDGGSDIPSGSSNGNFPPGGGGGGGGSNGNGDDHNEERKEDDEFGPLLNFEEVIKEAEARGAKLPSDMLEAAKTMGIQQLLLFRYFDLQASSWPLGFLIRTCRMLRNRMLADPSFLFKVGTEVVIDSCCATFAEVQKRGKDFWAEFELYAADVLVGIVVDIALVALLAPYAQIGRPSTPSGLFGRVSHALEALPSSVFEAERLGRRYSVQQRIATYIYKGFLYGSVGFVCGFVGQGIANMIMTTKRSLKKSEDDIPIPPLVKSAALWGVILAVSSNTRYQIINGLECLVEASPLAKQIPPVAMAFTVGVRFANNIYGGMQFVDWAKWSGCQ